MRFISKIWSGRWLSFLRGQAAGHADTQKILNQYQRIFRGAHDYGYFDWSLTKDSIVWSGSYWSNLGYSESDVLHMSGTKSYFSYVHPDDLETLMAWISVHTKPPCFLRTR